MKVVGTVDAKADSWAEMWVVVKVASTGKMWVGK